MKYLWNCLQNYVTGLSDDKSALVQVLARCCQATSHYRNQCWPSSMSSYGFTGPKWVNSDTFIYLYQSDYNHYVYNSHFDLLLGINVAVIVKLNLSSEILILTYSRHIFLFYFILFFFFFLGGGVIWGGGGLDWKESWYRTEMLIIPNWVKALLMRSSSFK